MRRPSVRIREATATALPRLVTRLFAAFGFLVLALAVLPALVSPSSSQSDTREEIYRQLTFFGDVYQRVREEYIEEIGDEDLISSAINGMLTSLDPHSGYLGEDAFREMREKTKGEFGGLGIEITMEDGLVKVISPIDDTPAARAGIQPGDLIVGINDEDVLGLSLSEAVDLMRGPVGTDVDITVRREGVEQFNVSLTRDVIKTESVETESYDDIGYIRVTRFNEQTTSGLNKAIDSLRKTHGETMAGVVLDLRANPGGLLTEAIKVADTFLDQGEIVSTRGRNTEDTSRHYASRGDRLDGLPMVVLINSGSASASEIVAGALKDHRRALVMGTRSFGKGSVQSIIPIDGHGAIRLTTARYYTPSGTSIQATGIEPDILVERARVEDIDGGVVREEDLRGALANTGDGERERDGDDGRTNLEDYQLARAIDLLRGYSIFHRVVE